MFYSTQKSKLDRKSKVERFELIDALDNSRFKIKDELKILEQLREIQTKKAFLAVHDLTTHEEFLSIIFDIHAESKSIIFDAPDNFLLRRKNNAGKALLLTTTIDRVRIQFKLHDVKNVPYAGNSALIASFPDELIRLQRREFYRLIVDNDPSIQCAITLNSPFSDSNISRYEIYDISVGGIGINNFPFHQAGEKITNLHIFLSNEETIVTDVITCHTFSIYLKSGKHIFRTGCRFADLSTTRDQKIQHYINKVNMIKRIKSN